MVKKCNNLILTPVEFRSQVRKRRGNEVDTQRLNKDWHEHYLHLKQPREFRKYKLSRTGMQAILEISVGHRIINYYLDKIGSDVSPAKIREACNRQGITSDGYAAVYKTC